MSLKEVLKQLGIKLIGWVKSNCVNNLLSDRADLPLAAAQGKVIDEKITALNSNITIFKAQSLIVTTNASGDFGLDVSTKDITIISATPKDSWLPCSLCITGDKWGIHSLPNTTFRLNYIYY